jgi:phosphatidylserine decarboxylase
LSGTVTVADFDWCVGSLRDCFIRELKEGARPVSPDPNILVSPCDAIIGASGPIRGTDLLQLKNSSYSLADLLGGDRELAEFYIDGTYATLRLTAAMYHRFMCRTACVSTGSGIFREMSLT